MSDTDGEVTERWSAAMVLTNRAPSELVTAIEVNHVEHFKLFGRIPGAEMHDDSDMMWVITGIPHPMLNGVFRTTLASGMADARISETLGVFRERRVPVRWAVGPSSRPSDLHARLERSGVGYVRDWIGMAIDLDTLADEGLRPPGLVVRPVRDDGDLRLWVQAFCSGAHVPGYVGDALRETFAGCDTAFRHQCRLYIGSLQGEAIATSVLFFGGGVAGIHWVYTAPSARRRGIGGAMTTTALHDARGAGYRYGVLNSTQMGEHVYRQLGFEPVCRTQLHVLQHDAEHRL